MIIPILPGERESFASRAVAAVAIEPLLGWKKYFEA
jgi:hypothetical protein